jgi:diguanylate cyclase (GGDEF)-like protein/PAS domain S-box-containing protein
MLDCLPDPVFVIDGSGALLLANEAAERILGWSPENWIGRNVLGLIHPDDLGLVELSMASIAEKAVGTAIEIRVATAAGSWRLLEVIGTNRLDDPAVRGIVLVGRDLTERRRYELAGDDSERFRAIIQYSAALIMLTDADGRIRSTSAAVTRILGHDPETVAGRLIAQLVKSPGRVSSLLNAAATTPGTSTFDAEFIHADGCRVVPLELSVVNLRDDPVIDGLIISGHDITPLRNTQRQLEYVAFHDPLTGLANRALLHDRLSAALARAKRARHPVNVLFIDLDDLKEVNDAFGHQAGDEMLREMARRLEAVTRSGDTVARFGGDEFVIVTEGQSDNHGAVLADRIRAALGDPFLLGPDSVQMRASIGVATSADCASADELLRVADQAMYEGKRRAARLLEGPA